MLWILSLLAVSIDAAVSPAITSALAQFCATTNIRDVLGWCSPGSPCSWGGVTCVGNDVVELDLSVSELNGTWPSAFDAQMAGLTTLNIGSNDMTGSISTTFFERQASTLVEFFITASQVTFELQDISLLHELVFFRSINTPIIGTATSLPPLDAPNLLLYFLAFSAVDGVIPPNYFIGAPALTDVRLYGNSLSGPAPDFCAHSLQTLDLSRNRFNEIPFCYTGFSGTTCDMRSNIKCLGTVPNNAPGQVCVFDEFPNAPFDVCGVCAGAGESCTDCLGAVSGTATADACGVCNGDGTSCMDCAGVPFGISTYDLCDVCGGTNDCLDCNGVPNGSSLGDVCGVCNGDGTSCFDCAGVLNGTSQYDHCDVCNGEDSTCPDCFGVPAGPARVDLCGICGGFNECIDCHGVVHGGVRYDRCGVCGGNGTSCGLGEVFENTPGLNIWIIATVSVLTLLAITIAACVYFRS